MNRRQRSKRRVQLQIARRSKPVRRLTLLGLVDTAVRLWDIQARMATL